MKSFELLLTLLKEARTSTSLTDSLLLSLENSGFSFECTAGSIVNSLMNYDIHIHYCSARIATFSFQTVSNRKVKSRCYRLGSSHHLAYIYAIHIAISHLNSLDNPPAARNVIELFKSRA